MTDQTPASLSRALLALAEKATPGPWAVTTCLDFWVQSGEEAVAHCGDIHWPDYQVKQDKWETNARLIALSREAAPAIARAYLEAVENMRRINDALETAICLLEEVERKTNYAFDSDFTPENECAIPGLKAALNPRQEP